ncbi:zinc-binding alcohol dehydrogenase family protein [Candidatus Mycobacterium wuenschmannii]|uniref:Zinc-binding alcohol dehydrogenase family protein n=1 Tax=Candidatus Mycobacterium wuenschmannii TaxID=3027808 RepID=A0ABY8VWL2_9MYCO|nr:zinc-binding alcohol dehydrogenase family protein [Candidatus Mycobacterium wuenschmannii]WIM88038.1 zinc-binding alcohol dehydrogenase family protein [Candidatus Mycobacterium wuenschmannii]
MRFTEFGDPDVLRVVDVADPVATAQEAIVRVHAASVNPSDVKNVAGAMDWTVLPRTPGRDFAGVVVSGPGEWKGAAVWGTGGDTGFSRDGSHAQLMTVPVAALARKPERLSVEEASAVGVNFVTAWYGLVETAEVVAGETVAVFGVTGGVGGAVAQIAHTLGANVIGVGRRPPAAETPAAAAIDEFVTYDAAAGISANVVYDAVGGSTTPTALAALARRGRLVVISAIGSPLVEVNIRALYRNETRILGVDSGKLTIVDSAEYLRKMAPHFESGAFRPLPITGTYSLEDGIAAYRAVASNTAGRVVIRP